MGSRVPGGADVAELAAHVLGRAKAKVDSGATFRLTIPDVVVNIERARRRRA
ncbi:MAG: hypothetical protein ACREDO_12505 [Methyloceanibacter sp.]